MAAVMMTKEWLVKHCKQRGLYQTPYLNDKLYLQCQAICDIENLDDYTGVKLLYLEENCLESMNGIQPLKQLQCLILDLSHNNLKDGNGVLEIALAMPRLAVLYLTGNPFISRMPHYRKNIIGNLKKLTHLDDRPVFWDERLYAEAWVRGGQDAETAERDIVRQIRAEEETKQFESMRRIREQSMEERVHVPRPNYLQFDPKELGEDAPEMCGPHDQSPKQQILCESKDVQNELSLTPPGEIAVSVGSECSRGVHQAYLSCAALDAATDSSVESRSHQSELSSSVKTTSNRNNAASLKEDSSQQQFEERPANNPLFNNCTNPPGYYELQKNWPRANLSMISSKVQSKCLPGLVGSNIQADSFSTIHNNTLFSEKMAKSGDSKAEPGQCELMQYVSEDQRTQKAAPRFSSLRESGRDALASLVTLDMTSNIHRKLDSTVKDENNLLLSLQAMGE
ncbi:hypothetical protein R1flu_013084 [Riccia fluitans]|uniref:Dynein assembly factor 1, axonemal n=1 Tax=Riccia fluitans TaxID=41844 RepID=A0ABD1ZGH2_9MARC